MIKDIRWVVMGRMILVEAVDVITKDDLKNIVERTRHMIETEGIPPLVHILYDVRQRGEIARDLININELKRIANPGPDLGWTLIVDPYPHKVMKLMADILMQVLKMRLRVFTTLPDAINFIYDMDKTLPALDVELT